MSRTLKVSSSAVAKTIKRYDETASHEDRHRKEDPELPLLQRINSIKLPASEIITQIIASHISTVQSILHESGLHGQIAAKKPLLKDTNNKKRLAWAKKQEQEL